MNQLVSVAAAVTMLCSGSALATMTPLTEKPSLATKDSCGRWSAKQSEDALEMWGVNDNGTSSKEVAITRLTKHCLGDKIPEIVGFGSSAGFDKVYCKNFPTVTICHPTRTNSPVSPSSERFICWGTYSNVQSGAAMNLGWSLCF